MTENQRKELLVLSARRTAKEVVEICEAHENDPLFGTRPGDWRPDARDELKLARAVKAMGEVLDLIGAWRSAECSRPDWHNPEGLACDGANHREDCPVELARQEMLAAHNALGAPGMEK